jgi:hypothetical protein
MAIIHSDRLQLSIDVFTNIFLIFGFFTAFYQFYVFGMERSSIEGELTDAISAVVTQNRETIRKDFTTLKPVLETLLKLNTGDADSTTITNQNLFTIAWMITGMFAVLVITLTISFFGYRNNPYFKKHPLSIGDILFKNLWMFIIAGAVEGVFFLKIAAKFTPVPPSALIGTVVGAIKTEFGVPQASNACPQRDIRAQNGEKCSNIWMCATPQNELISAVVIGVVLLATILAVTLQPLAFPFVFTMQPNTLQEIEMDQFSNLSSQSQAQVRQSPVINTEHLGRQKSFVRIAPF